MSKRTVTAHTALGTFTRRTDNAYAFIIVNGDTNEALRWGGNVNASQAKNAQVAADGVNYFRRMGIENVVFTWILAAEPVQAERPQAETAEAPAPPVGDVLTRDEARALVGRVNVRQVGKSLVHDIKADRKDTTLARTLCGVPINGAAQKWLVSLNTINCPTCSQAAAKAALAICPTHGTDKHSTCLGCHRKAAA